LIQILSINGRIPEISAFTVAKRAAVNGIPTGFSPAKVQTGRLFGRLCDKSGGLWLFTPR